MTSAWFTNSSPLSRVRQILWFKPFYHLSDKLPNSNAGTVIFQNIQAEIKFIIFIALFGWLTETPEEVSTADEASDDKYRATDTPQPANPESTDEEIMKFLEDSRNEKMAQFMSDDTGDFPELERY